MLVLSLSQATKVFPEIAPLVSIPSSCKSDN